MPFVGDLERLFAQLYPNRVPIAVGALVVLVALAVLGYRRGWHRIARRHPRASGALLAVAVVVGVPVTWVLASPLFIRTELVEPLPVATGSPGASARAAASAEPGLLARAGSFVGADEFHFGSGTARLVETEPGRFVVRFEDFSVRNGPDLYVYLSPSEDGYEDGAVELGLLKATDGTFNYDVPSGVDVDDVRSVVIWCRAFAVQFAHATLGDA